MEDLAYALLPHAYCLAWDYRLIIANAASDFLIFAAYAIIPMFVIRAANENRLDELITKENTWMWFSFILTCGATHAISVFSLFEAMYVSVVALKVLTVAFSWLTAVDLFLTLKVPKEV